MSSLPFFTNSIVAAVSQFISGGSNVSVRRASILDTNAKVSLAVGGALAVFWIGVLLGHDFALRLCRRCEALDEEQVAAVKGDQIV